MFLDEYDWEKKTGAQSEQLLSLINPIQGTHLVSPRSATVETCRLPFYTSTILVRLKDTLWAPPNASPVWFLAKQGIAFVLDGSSTPIHDANAADPIKITEENALDYVRFFCYFVHADEGPFLVIEDLNYPALDTNKLDPSKRKEIEEKLRKAAYEGKTPGGAFRASATVLYGNNLFYAEFSLTEDGSIEMINDEPLMADLPVRKV